MERRLRTRLNLLIPSVEKHVEVRQYSTIVGHTANRGFHPFNAGDTVLARNHGKREKWMRGVISEVLGSQHYMVHVSGNLWKRHMDQLLSQPVDVAPLNNPLVIEDHSMPLKMAPAVDRSDEIVPPTSGVPTATSESQLTNTSEQFYSRSLLPRVLLPVTNDDHAIRVPPVSLSETTDSVSNAVLDNQSSSCKTSALPCSQRRYHVRATRGLPSYLKDYELK